MERKSEKMRMALAIVILMLALMPSVHASIECYNCSDCSQKIQTASPRDIIKLAVDITGQDGTCIDLNGADGITFDCDGHTIKGDGDFDGSGIYLSRDSDDNQIKNCEISDFRSGIYIFCSSNNTIQNLMSYSNDDGIKILYGNANTVSDSVAQENYLYDFYFLPGTIGDCNNKLTNVTGSGDRPIWFYNQSVNLQDQEFSVLCLCNADNSILNNITIQGSDNLDNNGLRLFYTDNSNLTDITSSHNFEGILLDDDTCSNTLRNIRCNDNHHQGIMVQYDSDHNRLDDVETRSNGQCGIYLLSCSSNILTNITSGSNSFAGVYIDRSSSTTINNSYITGNNICGINVKSGDNLIYNNYFCNDENVNFTRTTVYANDWNITNTTGPNIVGKPNIGGNYWSDYRGMDNNSDGFGDTPYNVNGTGESNIDYLPLYDPPDIRVYPTTLNFKIAQAFDGRDSRREMPMPPPRSQPTEPIDKVFIDGKPPEILRAPTVSLPEPHITAGINLLSDVPAFDWSYGCFATAAAMMMGYYDNNGYSNMYTGPANDGVCPLNNSVWGTGECPLSATHQGLDGLTVRGHVDDYWISYGSGGPDPYVANGWAQQTWGNCTADFMGTNQYKFGVAYGGNTDGGTWYWHYSNGSPLYDYYAGTGEQDGCYGLRRFVESRGYVVLENFNQLIYGYNGNTNGFTFDDYMTEIDSGRPVIIQVTGHSMLGFGYDNSSGQQTIYIHDTWDHEEHEMQWGGNYSGYTHYGVTVMWLAPADCPQQAGVFSIIEDDGKLLTIDSIAKNESWITLDLPDSSFTMVGYGQRAVIVRVNSTQVIGGDSDVITITSNDPYESPYPGGVTVAVWRCGDVNCGGTVDMSDVIDLLYYVGYPSHYTICNEWSADVNCDKCIDLSDVIDLLYYVGYPGQYELKCCYEISG